jgi:hypothetical protein
MHTCIGISKYQYMLALCLTPEAVSVTTSPEKRGRSVSDGSAYPALQAKAKAKSKILYNELENDDWFDE